jgi:hypothetical protein
MVEGQKDDMLEGEAVVEWEPGQLFISLHQEGTPLLLLRIEEREREEADEFPSQNFFN